MLENLKLYAEIATGIAAVIALIYTGVRYNENRRTEKGKFLLQLKEAFSTNRRYKIHLRLRDRKRIRKWDRIDDYLGLFEVCNIMINNKSIEITDFVALYKYRLINLLYNNKVVFYKLVVAHRSYENFYQLLNMCFPEKRQQINNLKQFAQNIPDMNNITMGVIRNDFLPLWQELTLNL